MFKRKEKFKEKPQVRYHSIQDIIKGMQIACECGIREKAFDWKEIAAKGFINRQKIIKICKPYGKVRRVRHGFVIKFS